MILTQKKLSSIVRKLEKKDNAIGRNACFLLVATYDATKANIKDYNVRYIKAVIEQINESDGFMTITHAESKGDSNYGYNHKDIKDIKSKVPLSEIGDCYKLTYRSGGDHFIRVINDKYIYDPARGLLHNIISNFIYEIISKKIKSITYRGKDCLKFGQTKEVAKDMAKMDKFDSLYCEIIEKVIDYEGLWVNDKDDPGGETFAGVCRKYHPNYSGWSIIDSLKVDGKPKLNREVIKTLRAKAIQEVYPKYRIFESNVRTTDKNFYATLLFFSVHAGMYRATDFALLYDNLDDLLSAISAYYRRLFIRRPNMLKYRKNFEKRLNLFSQKSIKI